MNKSDVKLMLENLEILESEYVSQDEINSYPEDFVFQKNGSTYHWKDSDLNEEDIRIAIMAKQALYVRTIKNTVVFIFVLWIIGILFAIVNI